MGEAELSAQGMTAIEVHAVVDWLERHAVVYQINGGWAVDALVGHQTRPHRDLDLFVDEAAVDDILGWLQARGYAAETNWLPARLELRSGPLRVDVHPMVLDSDGNGVQRGRQHLTHQVRRRLGQVLVQKVSRVNTERSGHRSCPVRVGFGRSLEGSRGDRLFVYYNDDDPLTVLPVHHSAGLNFH
jgi:lincosamide nucleotidyltransferase A/C/D/E